MRFGQQQIQRDQTKHGVSAQYPEDPLPCRDRKHRTTRNRRDHGRGGHHHHHKRHHAGRLGALEPIPHDRPRHDRPRGCPHALHRACRNQHAHRSRQCADHARNQIQTYTKVQQWPSSITIRKRPIRELPQRHADEEKTQAILNIRGIDPKLTSKPRHGRQIHVDRQGCQRGEHAEYAHEDHMGTATVRRLRHSDRSWRVDDSVRRRLRGTRLRQRTGLKPQHYASRPLPRPRRQRDIRVPDWPRGCRNQPPNLGQAGLFPCPPAASAIVPRLPPTRRAIEASTRCNAAIRWPAVPIAYQAHGPLRGSPSRKAICSTWACVLPKRVRPR